MLKININRILVSVTAALSILMAVASVAVAETDAKNRVWEVADNVYRFGAAGGANGYYSMFVVTNDSVIAIEPVDPKHSQGLLAAIMGPFPWHPDHAYETKKSWSV